MIAYDWVNVLSLSGPRRWRHRASLLGFMFGLLASPMRPGSGIETFRAQAMALQSCVRRVDDGLRIVDSGHRFPDCPRDPFGTCQV